MPDGIVPDSGCYEVSGQVLASGTGSGSGCTKSPCGTCGGLYSSNSAGMPCYLTVDVSWSEVCFGMLGCGGVGSIIQGGCTVKLPAGSITFNIGGSAGISCNYGGSVLNPVCPIIYTGSEDCTGSTIIPSVCQLLASFALAVQVQFSQQEDESCNLYISIFLAGSAAIYGPCYAPSPSGGFVPTANNIGAIYQTTITGLDCSSLFPTSSTPPFYLAVGGDNSPFEGPGYTAADVFPFDPTISISAGPPASDYEDPLNSCSPIASAYNDCDNSPSPFPPPPLPIILYPSCPNTGTCADDEAQLCVQVVEAGLTACSQDITLNGPSSLCASGVAPQWTPGGIVGGCTGIILWVPITGGAGTSGPGNFILNIETSGGFLIWQGCSATLTGSYAYISGAAYGTTTYPAVTSVNVVAGACAACVPATCPYPNSYADTYTLNLAAGSVTICQPGSNSSQTVFTWSAQTVTMNKNSGGAPPGVNCWWLTEGVSATCVVTTYASSDCSGTPTSTLTVSCSPGLQAAVVDGDKFYLTYYFGPGLTGCGSDEILLGQSCVIGTGCFVSGTPLGTIFSDGSTISM